MPSYHRRRHVLAAFLLSLAGGGLLGSPVFASGQLPPRLLPTQNFASFDACLQHLMAVRDADQVGVADGAIADGENRTRQKLVYSKGIERIGPQSARYQAQVGNQFRVTDRSKGVIETNFSYDETTLECKDGELSGSVTSGYMLPGFEQLPVTATP